jgi:hypothetical protein
MVFVNSHLRTQPLKVRLDILLLSFCSASKGNLIAECLPVGTDLVGKPGRQVPRVPLNGRLWTLGERAVDIVEDPSVGGQLDLGSRERFERTAHIVAETRAKETRRLVCVQFVRGALE